MGQRQARRLEDALEVLEHLFGLGLDVASSHDLAGGGIQGNLAGEEDQVAEVDRLGVGPDGLGSPLAGDDLLGRHGRHHNVERRGRQRRIADT